MHGHPLRRFTESAPAAVTPPRRLGAVAGIDRDLAVVALSATTGKLVVRELFRGPPRPVEVRGEGRTVPRPSGRRDR